MNNNIYQSHPSTIFLLQKIRFILLNYPDGHFSRTSGVAFTFHSIIINNLLMKYNKYSQNYL